jgi:preprotein translocase subunit SecF
MKLENKKIIIFGLALLILSGIIVVMLKGFNVSLDLQSHDTLKFVFRQKFEKNDLENDCKEVYKNKKYKIKTVEVFTDAVYIISPSITDDEKTALLEKLNDLYKTEKDTVEENASNEETIEEAEEKTIYDELEEGKDFNFYSDAKVRIRDIVKPYIVPSIISAIIICIYVALKYRKLNDGKIWITILKLISELIVIILILLSLIAILRIKFTSTLIPLLMFIILICLVIRLSNYEKDLKSSNDKK